jgi:hypothetical protein
MAASAQAASQVFDFAADEAQLLRQRQQAASSSSRTKNAEKDASEVQETPRRPVSRGKKAVAAVTGAIATSLTSKFEALAMAAPPCDAPCGS